jgi:hypothetical protein
VDVRKVPSAGCAAQDPMGIIVDAGVQCTRFAGSGLHTADLSGCGGGGSGEAASGKPQAQPRRGAAHDGQVAQA